MQCARCQTDNPPQARFCLECASPLARSCKNCGTQLPPTAQFCPGERASIPGAPCVYSVWDALLECDRTGRHVAFVEADGNWQSVATAEHLADPGKQVTVMTAGAGYGTRISI